MVFSCLDDIQASNSHIVRFILQLTLTKVPSYCFISNYMGKIYAFFATLLFLGLLFHGGTVVTLRSQDGSEEWGYVEVKPSNLSVLGFCNFQFILSFQIRKSIYFHYNGLIMGSNCLTSTTLHLLYVVFLSRRVPEWKYDI